MAVRESFVVKLAGQRWTRRIVDRIIENGEDCDGITLHGPREILIAAKQRSDRAAFETEIHEAMHAQLPAADEAVIDRIGKELTELIFVKLGYRRAA